MHSYRLHIPAYELSMSGGSDDFGEVIELARQQACTRDAVVYIVALDARVGCPNRWSVSPKGYVAVEDVQLPHCMGCGG